MKGCMKKTTHKIVCDDCKEAKVLRINRAGGMSAVVRVARKKGWSIGKAHICPECIGNESDGYLSTHQNDVYYNG